MISDITYKIYNTIHTSFTSRDRGDNLHVKYEDLNMITNGSVSDIRIVVSRGNTRSEWNMSPGLILTLDKQGNIKSLSYKQRIDSDDDGEKDIPPDMKPLASEMINICKTKDSLADIGSEHDYGRIGQPVVQTVVNPQMPGVDSSQIMKRQQELDAKEQQLLAYEHKLKECESAMFNEYAQNKIDFLNIVASVTKQEYDQDTDFSVAIEDLRLFCNRVRQYVQNMSNS